MKVVAMINQKGGVGKTATAVNFGVAIAKNGYKVLLIDCDPQGSLTKNLGYQDLDEFRLPTLRDVFVCGAQELPYPDVIISPINEKKEYIEPVDLVPVDSKFAEIEGQLFGQIGAQTVLKEYIEFLKDTTNYDYVILDSSPNLSIATLNALTAADEIIIPVTPEIASTQGLGELCHTIGKVRRYLNRDLNVAGILFTMVNNNAKMPKEIMDSVTNEVDFNIFKTRISRSIAVSNAATECCSVITYKPGSKSAQEYTAAANEYLNYAKAREHTMASRRSCR